MAKRSSLNRRSSKSSRYSDSAVLNPDTDVVDNTYPYWSKHLENNTIVRPSTDYNMFSETSRQLDSNSQVELSGAETEWWKVFDNFSSSEDNENNTQQSASKFTIVTSESEEEPRIKKRKLSLWSKARTHKNNAFFNVLHDSEGTSANSSVQKVKGKNSINNSASKNKEMTNKEQLAEMQDSSSNQSSNLNNIVKSKPKIFKKDYKNQNNIFIDVLQNSEFKVPSSSKCSITKSPKPVERKDSSILQTSILDNQSESNEHTLSSGSVPDFSHFPVPKAQSTAFEDSAPFSSSRNDSSSDIEPEIMKQKPKLLNRRSRSIKKNVYKNIFIAEESNEETEGNVLASRSVVENTEIPQRFSTSLSTDSHKISHKSQKNVINEDENKGTEISSSRKKRKSAILAERNIEDCTEKEFLSKKVTANDRLDDSIASSIIPPQPLISLPQEKAGSKSLSSIDNNTKQKNAQGRSTLDQSIINGKNVTKVHKDVAKDYNDELQVGNKQKNISLTRSAVHTLLSFEEGNRDNAKNRSRLSHITSNSTSSIKRNKSLRGKEREIEKEISEDSSDEEIVIKLVDDRKMKKRSIPKDLSSFSKKQPDTVKDSKRSSSRNGNLTSSVNRIQDIGSNTSNVNNKVVRPQNLNSICSEETFDQSKYIKKSITALDRKSVNVSSSSNSKQHNNIDTNSLNVDKNIREVENEVSSDSNDENLARRSRRISQRRSVANVSSSINRKEDSNAGVRGRVSSRVSNLVLSGKKGTQKNIHAASVAGEDAREIEGVLQAIGNEETPRTSRHSHTDHRSTSQRKSNSSNTSRKDRSTAENRRSSTRISNLALSTNKIEDVVSKTAGVNDESANEIENEFSSDSDYDILIHRPDPLYKITTADISSSINRKERSVKEKQSKSLRIISDVMLSTKELIPTHGILSNVDEKNEKESKRKVEVSQAAGNEEIPKQRRVSQRKSVSLNHSAKERSNEKNLRRASSRNSNLVLSTKESTRMNPNASNIRDEDKIEAVEEATNDSANEEVPNELQQPDKNSDTFQRESGANVSSALNKTKQDNVRNLRKVSSRIGSSFSQTPTNKDKSKSKGQMSIKNFVTNIAVDEEKVKMIRERLEKVKKQEMEKMNAQLKQGEVKSSETKNIIKRKKSVKPKEGQIHKAYLVNGVVYKVPRLPRPKSWVTNRLYDHLWKVMEPKYNLNTRVISEKFVRQMCGITTIIAKQKSYERYRDQLDALMKEMARLGIIRTRNEFYHFCHEFLPYELVEKMVPMLLPGNKKNMPFDPNTLYEPLIGS